MSKELELKIELRNLKAKLAVGDQRELAKRLGTYPGRIADAFDGFVRNIEFMSKLVTETLKLIKENETATTR